MRVGFRVRLGATLAFGGFGVRSFGFEVKDLAFTESGCDVLAPYT